MRLDNVELDITDEALHEMAKKAIKLKSGARVAHRGADADGDHAGQVPSDPTIIQVTVDADAVLEGKPKLEYGVVRKRYNISPTP